MRSRIPDRGGGVCEGAVGWAVKRGGATPSGTRRGWVEVSLIRRAATGIAVVRGLGHGHGGVAAGGSFLDVGGIIANFVQAVAAEKYGAFFDDQHVITLQKKCHALTGLGHQRRTEELRRDGDGRRRRRLLRTLGAVIIAGNLLGGFRRRRRRPEDENIAMRAGII